MFRVFSLIVAAACLVLATRSAAAPPLEAYGHLPAVEAMSLSPSGDRLAFIGVNGEQRKLYVGTTEGKALLQAATGTAKVRGLVWAGDDHLLVLTSATIPMVGFTTERLELYTIVAIDVPAHKSVVLLSDANKFVPYAFGYNGVAQVGGRWYAYLGVLVRENGRGEQKWIENEAPDLYRVDVDTGDAVKVAAGGDTLGDWLVDPANGQVIARTTYDQRSSEWRVIAGAEGGLVLASGRGKYGGAELHRGRTPDEVLIGEPREDGGTSWQDMSLSGRAVGAALDGDTIRQPIFDETTHLWIGSELTGDRQEVSMFAPDREARVQALLKAFPDKTVMLESADADFSHLIAFTSGTADSGTHYLVDMRTGHADALGYDYPTIGPADVGTIEMIDYKAADGMQLHGVLDLPAGREAKNLPVVVLPHGGPQVRDYPTFDWWTEAFASRGYAVFRPNYRGSGDLGTPFRNAGFGQWGRKMETDITDGLAELAHRGIVDPKRACIVGWSYGGYASLAGVTVQNGFYRCAVAGGAVSHPGEMIDRARGETTDSSERYWEDYMGAKSATQTQLPDITPVTLARRADAPILLIHGRDDTVVPMVQEREMEAALRGAGKPVEVLILPTSDHWLLHEDAREQVVKASVEFVEKYNPPDAAPPQTQAQVSSASAVR
ncbi:MAG TPA: alpha/beta fold hydrolase [Caulobacteraceae bacterium]|nr:alpha/beta fold hydrolase [Caulobacteraceae bacterium]